MTRQPTLPATVPAARPVRVPRGLGPYLCISPFFLLLLVFGLFPLLFSFVIAFYDWNPLGPLSRAKFDGLWTYRNIFTDPDYWPALGRTLGTGLGAALWQHAVALPLAYFVHLAFRRAQGVLGTVLFLPYITPPVATGAVLPLLFAVIWRPLGNLYGAVQSLPVLNTVLPFTLNEEGARTAFNLVWTTLGWNVLLYLMALNAIPRSLYEAAQVDGAGMWRQVRSVTLPLLRPMIFVAFTLSFLAAVQGVVWNPTAPLDVARMTIPEYVIRTGFWDFDMGLAAGQTWVFFAAVLLVVGAVYLLIGRHYTALDTSAQGENDETPLRLAPAPGAALRLLIGLALAAAVLPVAALLLNASRAYPGFSLEWGNQLGLNYDDLLERVPNFWRNLWNTAYMSGLAALGAVLTSSLAGYAFALLAFRFRRPLYAVVMGVMLFPSLMNIIPTAMTMHLLGWMDTARALWLPAAASALGILLTRQFLASALPRSVVEAARVDGAGTFGIFLHIVLPVARPVLVAVGLISFIGAWNSSISALAVLHLPETQLVNQALSLVVRPDGGAGAFALGSAVATLPTLLLFVLASVQLARGLNLSAGGLARPRLRWGRFSIPASTPRSPLTGLDGVRALACLMVIGHHLSQRLNPDAQWPAVREARDFVMTGAVGVSAFFVLSGALLSLPFWRRYLVGKPHPDLRDYARRRALRIVPGFWASLVLSVLLTVALVPDAQQPWLRVLSAATFTSAFHYLTFFPADLNGPLWSIGFEVVCYALMPLGMLVMFALGRRRGAATGFGIWFALLGLTLLGHQFILTHFVPGDEDRGWQYGIVGGAKSWMPNYNPVGLFGHYILGVLAAGVLALRQARGAGAAWWNDAVALLAGLGLVGLLWNVRHAPEFSLSLGRQPYFYPLFPSLVAAFLCTLPFSRLAGRLLDNRFFRYTARISFGLYIWHFLILELIRLLHNSRFVYAGIESLGQWSVLSGVALLLSYGAASLSYRYIEEPFLRGVQHRPAPERA